MKILTLLIFLPFMCFGQKQNKLSFEFGIGRSTFSMNDLNKYYIDSFALTNKLLEKRILKGNQFFLGLKYRPNSLFDIGLYGNYQVGKSAGKPQQIITDNQGIQIGIKELDFILKTEAIGIGISNCWYFSHFLKFHEKENNFLKNLHLGFALNIGIGFSTASLDFRDPELIEGTTYNFFTSRDFQGRLGLNFEYAFIKAPLISSIGLKAGYQYFLTKTVVDRNGNDWIVKGTNRIRLDFSGVFGMIYLSIGK